MLNVELGLTGLHTLDVTDLEQLVPLSPTTKRTMDGEETVYLLDKFPGSAEPLHMNFSELAQQMLVLDAETDADCAAPADDIAALIGEAWGRGDAAPIATAAPAIVPSIPTPAAVAQPPTPPPAPRGASPRGAGRGSRRPPRTSAAAAARAIRSAAPSLASKGSDSEEYDGHDGPSPLPAYTGPLPDSFWNLTDEQLASITFKDFTKLMAKSKLSDKQVAEQKKKRRRVKNRFSARQCSERKKNKVANTEGDNQHLRLSIAELTEANNSLRTQHMMLQERFIELQKASAAEAREKIFLRAEVDRLNDLLKLGGVTDAMAISEHTPVFAGAA